MALSHRRSSQLVHILVVRLLKSVTIASRAIRLALNLILKFYARVRYLLRYTTFKQLPHIGSHASGTHADDVSIARTRYIHPAGERVRHTVVVCASNVPSHLNTESFWNQDEPQGFQWSEPLTHIPLGVGTHGRPMTNTPARSGAWHSTPEITLASGSQTLHPGDNLVPHLHNDPPKDLTGWLHPPTAAKALNATRELANIPADPPIPAVSITGANDDDDVHPYDLDLGSGSRNRRFSSVRSNPSVEFLQVGETDVEHNDLDAHASSGTHTSEAGHVQAPEAAFLTRGRSLSRSFVHGTTEDPALSGSAGWLGLPIRRTASPASSFRSATSFGGTSLAGQTSIQSVHEHVDIPSSSSPVPMEESPCHACSTDCDELRRHGIRPITTEYIRRYERNVCIPTETTIEHIKPVTTLFERGTLPRGWAAVAHPEGCTYFWNPHERILTDAWMYDDRVSDIIEANAKRISAAKELHKCKMPKNIELVLELDEYQGTSEVWYYYVDHDTRCLFWLNTYYTGGMLVEINGVRNISHIKHELEAHYWTHWEYFPLKRDVEQGLVHEVVALLSYAGMDVMTSKDSTIPYNSDQLGEMVGFVKNIKTIGGVGGFGPCYLGRIMSIFAHQRFLNFHGEAGARLSSMQSVHGGNGGPTWLITFLSPALFCAPDVHLRHLERIYVDQVISEHPWKRFITSLEDEWQGLITIATILLTANVAFLAIPSVDQPFGPNTSTFDKSPCQISSYVSVVMSIGSIVMSLLQVRQHRNKFRHTAADAARYLTSKTHPKYGLETLAILYALPYALLMWSTLAFVVAVGLLCFQNTSTVVRATVGGSVAVVGALTCWCIYTAWEINEWSWWTRITELVMEQSKKLGWRSACALITGRQVVRPNGSPDHV